MGFSLKKFVKKVQKGVRLSDFDPTSKNAMFGGVVKGAIGFVPGVGAIANAGLDVAKSAKGQAKVIGDRIRVADAKAGINPTNPTAANAMPAIAGADPLVNGGKSALVVTLALAAVAAYFLFKK